MRNADPLGHRARVVNILAGATGAAAMRGGAVVVELQGHPHHVIAFVVEKRGRDRGIDPTRHRHDDARVLRPALEIERIEHRVQILSRGAVPRQAIGLRPTETPYLNGSA